MENRDVPQITEQSQVSRPFLTGLGRPFSWLYRATLAKPLAREILIGLLIFGSMVAVLQFGLESQRIKVEIGQPAPQTLIAKKDIKDTYATAAKKLEKRKEAALQAEQDPANWFIAPESRAQAEARLEKFMADLDRARATLMPPHIYDTMQHTSVVAALSKEWPEMPAEAWDLLLAGSADSLDRLEALLGRYLVNIEENSRISELNLRSFRESLADVLRGLGGDPGDAALLGALRALVAPNLTLDRARVERIAAEAVKNMSAQYIDRGTPIIEKGAIVNADRYKLLDSLGLISGNSLPLGFLSMILFVLTLIVLAIGYLYRFRREILRQERLLYLMALTMIIAAIMGKFFASLSPNLPYFAPVAFAGIIWVLLLDSQVALMLTVLLSLLMGVVTGYQLSFTLYTLVSCSTAIFVVYQRDQRKDLMRSGLFIAMANIFSAFLITLMSGVWPNLKDFGTILALAAFNGITAAVVAIGLLPFMENIFGLTSAVHLLELANPNQPLIKQLLVDAPGTYHHSIIVGNLAIAAADAVGANPLLVRVGAYYHDIGKIKRPYFFVENQIAQDNPHEKLTPTLSTLIITAHVKEGVEVARQAGLPEAVVDIIEQHHGTDLVRYFYARAAENTQADVAETDFRYDGPRPQTKEAALVMLADSVEAAVHAMAKPSPAKIEVLIAKVIKERLTDGQFDQCALTLKDLENIKAAFLKVLGGIFHSRIEYPESLLREFERKKGGNGDTRKQPAG